jgi:hypothetical protein
MNTTLASNLVAPGAFFDSNTEGPAGGANLANTNGTLTLINSIVAGGDTNGNAWGAVTDGGFNISSDGTCNFSSGSSFNYTNPQLQPLADNGGFTLTMALAPDSPAIDFGSSIGAPLTDQRGVARPFGSGVDMGAYEAGPTGPTLHIEARGDEIEVSFQAAAATSYQLYSSPNLQSWEPGELIPAQPSAGIVTRTFSSQPARFFRVFSSNR